MHWPAAIIFDVDGTLAETEEWHRDAFNQAFAEHGLDWHWDRERYRQLLRVTGGRERIRHFAAETGFDAASIDVGAIHVLKNRLYQARVSDGPAALRPGVEALIRHARARRIRLGIATTTSRANATALVRRTLGTRALNWFPAFVCGEDVPAKKPHPAAYLQALARLKLAPQAALAVEDSRNGLRAARSAGLPCLVTPSFYTEGEHLDGACRVLRNLAQHPPGRLLAALAPTRDKWRG